MEDLVEYLLHDRQHRLFLIQMIFGVPNRVDLPLANVTAEFIIEGIKKTKLFPRILWAQYLKPIN